MADYTNKLNKNAVQYSSYVTSRVQEICDPLVKYLGIKIFAYMRLFNDRSYLFLTNGYEDCRKLYLQNIRRISNFFYDSLKKTYVDHSYKCVRAFNCDETDPVEILLHDHGLFFGLVIVHRYENYVEKFSFGLEDIYGDNAKFYHSNMCLLEEFISYFKVQARDLIDIKDRSVLAKYRDKFDISCGEISINAEKFLQEIRGKNGIIVNKSGVVVQLSKRETECIKCIADGKIAKEIARELGISPRTVEHHINNIKYKTSLYSRSEIITAYTKVLRY